MFFNCDKCYHEFEASLSNISRGGTWCPFCKTKTEGKLKEFLKEFYPSFVHQYRKDWCRNAETGRHLPFDFCSEQLKVIIELDGPQHFVQVSNWQSPDEAFQRDFYKQQCANKNGFSIIRLLQEDVWEDKINWKEKLTEALSKTFTEVSNIYISESSIYEKFNECPFRLDV